tara:strand:+ start:999 stop:1724 length:726 start_codon:yes stop_codon:yes gene_type:complete
MNTSAGYEKLFSAAVGEFWRAREGQAKTQRDKGVADAGSRGSVTGGKHLDSITGLVRKVFLDADPAIQVHTSGTDTVLPGYYRGSKDWDMVVTYDQAVVAIVEMKSQVGSFGNNLNNRVEEMVGQSLDLWRASRESLLGDLRPWFAYLMLLEDSEKSRKPVGVRTRVGFPPDPQFVDASYMERYGLAFSRARREGDVDAVCLAVSRKSSEQIAYPDRSMTFDAFAAQIVSRVSAVKALLAE